MPETDSASCVIELMSASDACVRPRAARRRRPTRVLRTTKTGTRTSERTVSGTDRMSIATSVDATTTTFETTDDAVEVIVVCTPPTSLASRDCTSPDRVAV